MVGVSDWPNELAGVGPGDENLPGGFPGLNVVLNRTRMAQFLREFADDSDLRDFLVLDLLSVATDAEISSTGEVEDWPALALRPFRLWEYVWLYKALGLQEPGHRVLDLGGPASHIVAAAALSGNTVHSIDINPRIVAAGRQCAALFRLANYTAEARDMRDLSHLPADSFDRIVCCSVLEHLTGEDQRIALGEMARVLAPGGMIGLTFDYGPGAPGANIYLPPPHDPPASPDEVRHRYLHSGLEIVGNQEIELPVSGSLFHDDTVSYTMSALFLGRAPVIAPPAPRPVVRPISLISWVHVSELPDRLHRKIFAQSTDVQRMREESAAHQATVANFRSIAQERLIEVEQLSAEAHRRAEMVDSLTAEIGERERQTEALQSAALQRALALDEMDTERRALQQAVDQFRRAAEERLSALQEMDAALKQTRAEKAKLREDLVALQNRNLLTYLGRRFVERRAARSGIPPHPPNE